MNYVEICVIKLLKGHDFWSCPFYVWFVTIMFL